MTFDRSGRGWFSVAVRAPCSACIDWRQGANRRTGRCLAVTRCASTWPSSAADRPCRGDAAARPEHRSWCSTRAPYGRDKVCGDGLTPRAVGAMEELEDRHGRRAPDPWAADDRRYAGPRTRLADHRPLPGPRCGVAAPPARCGADRRRRASPVPRSCGTPRRCRCSTDGRVIGVEAGGRRVDAAMTVVACGAQGPVAAAARRRSCCRRAVRPGDPHLRRDPPPRRCPPRGVPVAARRARHPDPGLRLDVPGRRRHGEHRRRRAVDDEGLQEAEPQHAARGVPARRCRTTGTSARTSNDHGRGGCRCRRSVATARAGSPSAMPRDSSTR